MSSAYLTGWIEHERRTTDQKNLCAAAIAMMPAFAIRGTPSADKGPKVLVTDFWKHPEVTSAIGFTFPGIWQRTGSCVGAGLGNVIFTTTAVEVVERHDPEAIVIPFWLYPYGKSRQRGGMRGPGEGSFGATAAEAARLDGIPSQNYPGLPSFTNDDGLTWGADVEYKWSDGAAAPQDIVAEAIKHPIKTTTQIRSTADLRSGIREYYVATTAHPMYVNPRNAKITGGSNPCCLGKLDTRGGHQTSIQAVWDHPELGLLFGYVNQWQGVYPADPAGLPRCACWITEEDTRRLISEEETFLFSGYEGYPARPQLLRHII